MSLPKRKKNESDDVFVGRCLKDAFMMQTYKNKAQRHAVCCSQLKYKPSEKKNTTKTRKAKSKQSKSNKG